MVKTYQKELIRQLAIKYNATVAQVDKAVDFQFKFVEKTMAQELADIRLPFFGVFKVNPKKLQRIRERVENKKQKGDK